jgi:hypothetical protein
MQNERIHLGVRLALPSSPGVGGQSGRWEWRRLEHMAKAAHFLCMR